MLSYYVGYLSEVDARVVAAVAVIKSLAMSCAW